MLPIYHWNSAEIAEYLQSLDHRGSHFDPAVEARVATTLSAVRSEGDAALRRFTLEYDQVDLKTLRVSESEICSLANQVDPELRHILKLAKENIRRFHEHQLERSWEYEMAEGCR